MSVSRRLLSRTSIESDEKIFFLIEEEDEDEELPSGWYTG